MVISSLGLSAFLVRGLCVLWSVVQCSERRQILVKWECLKNYQKFSLFFPFSYFFFFFAPLKILIESDQLWRFAYLFLVNRGEVKCQVCLCAVLWNREVLADYFDFHFLICSQCPNNSLCGERCFKETNSDFTVISALLFFYFIFIFSTDYQLKVIVVHQWQWKWCVFFSLSKCFDLI